MKRKGIGWPCPDCSHRSKTFTERLHHHSVCVEAQLQFAHYVLADVAREFGVPAHLPRGGRETGRQAGSGHLVHAVRTTAIWRMWVMDIGAPAVAEAMNLSTRGARRYFREFEKLRANCDRTAA